MANTRVPDALTELGKLYAERNAMYGDDYKRYGKVMMVWFPNGVHLKTESDFNRFALFQFLVTKNSRYAQNFNNGGHEDSLNDISVYAQMLAELDHELRAGGQNEETQHDGRHRR